MDLSTIDEKVPLKCDVTIHNPTTVENKSTEVPSKVSTPRSSDVYWSTKAKGYDSRMLLFIVQVLFSIIAMSFGIYSVVSDVDKNTGIGLIFYVLGFYTPSPKTSSTKK